MEDSQSPRRSLDDTVDVEDAHQGAGMELLGIRKGELRDMLPDGRGRVRLDYVIPARGCP